MAQIVEYAFFPGVRDELLWPTVNKVLGHAHRNTLTMRDFRDWLKDAGLWQKDEAAALLALLDLRTEPHVTLGPWAQEVFAAADDKTAKDLLWKRLCDQNLLLCKYVLEALDVGGGGRLHSTSELHRMLTSYVYPGAQVGRVAFEAWIKWIVASGRVKLIGIRWGLTDLGKLAVPRMRTVDPDEFLEDEASPAAVTTTKASPAPAAPVPAGPAPTKPRPTASNVKATADVADEELPDMPPEAEPVDPGTFAAYEARLATEAPPTTSPRSQSVAHSGRTANHLQPHYQALTRASGPSQAPTTGACSQAPADPAEIVRQLREVANSRGLSGGGLLEAWGLETRMAHNDAARHLFLACLLARLSALPDAAELAQILQERAGGWGPVALLLERPEVLTEMLVRWGLAGADRAGAQLRIAVVEATLGGRSLKAQADLPTVLAEAPTSDALITGLHQGPLRAAPTATLFWLVREMVLAGLWSRPAAAEVAFVPTRPVRLMAYRLRLLDSHFALGLPAFVATARRLRAWFAPGAAETAALEVLAESDDLRLDCVRVLPCPQPCGGT